MNDREGISAYLYFGYRPAPGDDLAWVSAPCAEAVPDRAYTPSEAGRLLDAVVDALLRARPSGGRCVIPLSGGRDSRILLGAVMERVDREEIVTVTFGTPGQLDFEIGRHLARHFGLAHHALDLSAVELTWDALLDAARASPWSYVPDGYVNRLAVSRVACSPRDAVWSGFLGGSLTKAPFARAATWQEATDRFVVSQRRVPHLWLPPPGYDPRRALPPWPDGAAVTYGDLLNLGVRQARCIASILTPRSTWRAWGGVMGRLPATGAAVLAPFAAKDWATYWLQAPDHAKRGQRLYRRMLEYRFPELAAMPGKASRGLSPRNRLGAFCMRAQGVVRRQIHRRWPRLPIRSRAIDNYVDYQAAFRNRKDYIAVAEQALEVLARQDAVPWLDLDRLWQQHRRGRRDHAKALLVLLGLAVNLEVAWK
jgi:hypothetical protein